MNIRRKILLIVTPIVLAPLALLWATFYLTLTPMLSDADAMRRDLQELTELSKSSQKEARERFEAATIEAYRFGLANIGANIDGQLDAMEKSLLLSAHRDSLLEALARPNDSSARSDAQEELAELIQAHELWGATLVDAQGGIILRLRRNEPAQSGGSAVNAPWFKRKRAAATAADWMLLDADNSPAGADQAIVSASVNISTNDGSPPVGYLRLALPVANLAREIRGPKELTSSVRLVGNDGVTYWSEGGAASAPSSPDEALNIAQIVKGGIFNAEVQLKRDVVFRNLEPFDRLSGAIAANLIRVVGGNDRLNQKVNTSKNIILLAKLSLALVTVTLLYLFLGRMASRIEILNSATRRIRDGDLDVVLPPSQGGDEISALQESIDKMRRQIRQQIENLDRKVAERTRELDTANRQLEQEVAEKRKAEEKAIAASSVKSEFLATMSHEIRTPLSGIIGGIHLLIKSDLDEDQRTLAEVVQSSSETLRTLLNDILDFSRIEAGKLVLEEMPFDLAGAVREVCATFQFNARERGITLTMQDDIGDSLMRRGDATRLKQIVYNLVGNAVKFTREGGVTIRIGADSDDRNSVRIIVSDTGIGMTTDQVERVFDSFTQADSSVSRMYGGTGLGLTISSRLARLMKGSITAQSHPQKGSVFTLTLPLPLAAEAEEDPDAAGALPGRMATVPVDSRVLFAEDNGPNRLILRRTLEAGGFIVTDVPDGQACLEEAKQRPYDLILLDVSMPKLDGCAATRAIRAWEREQNAPHRALIVGLTANATSAQKRECSEAGMDRVLFKPISGSDLVDSCARLIAEDRRR